MSEQKKTGEGSGFRVIDRRGEAGEPEAAAPQRAAGQAPAPGAAAGSGSQGSPRQGLPSLDFSTFVLSLSTSALYHMGLVADPETGTPASPDFDLARQTIDILEMLEAKTRGNLESEEAKLLESLLYDLRMQFVEVRRS